MRRLGERLAIFLALASALFACGAPKNAPQAPLTAAPAPNPSPRPASGLQFYEFYSPL